MLIKLDMKNAFDHVKLSFLYQVLRYFGFSAEFVCLIKACTDRPWISPLVNGRPADFFQASRGLRQGCPLSPFLYILMAEVLSRKLSAEMVVGSLPGIKIARGVDPINHALFVDDSLLLGGASLIIARDFKVILQNFGVITGTLINKGKSVVYGWNVEHTTLLRIAHTLGFQGFEKWESIKWLGLPLTMGSRPSSLWNDVIFKIKAKIVSWGGYWLTQAAKLILIKAVLSALPIFQCSLLLAPKSVSAQIAKLLRDFLWEGGKGN